MLATVGVIKPIFLYGPNPGGVKKQPVKYGTNFDCYQVEPPNTSLTSSYVRKSALDMPIVFHSMRARGISRQQPTRMEFRFHASQRLGNH